MRLLRADKSPPDCLCFKGDSASTGVEAPLFGERNVLLELVTRKRRFQARELLLEDRLLLLLLLRLEDARRLGRPGSVEIAMT